MCLEASENLFRVIYTSRLPDAGEILFILAKLFDCCQNKLPAGCMRNSTKFVFTLKSMSSSYLEQVKMG